MIVSETNRVIGRTRSLHQYHRGWYPRRVPKIMSLRLFLILVPGADPGFF